VVFLNLCIVHVGVGKQDAFIPRHSRGNHCHHLNPFHPNAKYNSSHVCSRSYTHTKFCTLHRWYKFRWHISCETHRDGHHSCSGFYSMVQHALLAKAPSPACVSCAYFRIIRKPFCFVWFQVQFRLGSPFQYGRTSRPDYNVEFRRDNKTLSYVFHHLLSSTMLSRKSLLIILLIDFVISSPTRIVDNRYVCLAQQAVVAV
jgi:hypothetical protein